jgi:hypothetical protein
MAQRVSNLVLEPVMKILIALAAVALPIVGIADTVVPVDKVETHVNIRQAPDSSADTVSRLQQGSSLPFVASADGWNEVRLENGDSGFISADWTVVVVEDAADTETETEPELEAEAVVEEAVEPEPESEPEAVVEEIVEPEPEPELVVEEVVEPESESDAVVEEVEEVEEVVEPEPEVAPEVMAVVPVAAAEGPTGPAGPAGPIGPPGIDGDGSMKGNPGYLVKFKNKTTGKSSQVFDNGNQIGIGTDEPTQRLEVNGSVQIHDRNSNLAGLMITQADGETGYIMHNRASTLTIGAGSIDRITIDRDGNVGIGASRPSHPLELASGAHVTAGGVWTNSSSRTKKENIAALTLDDALAALARLEPVHFNYKTDTVEQHVGFIAEDVPDIVATSDRTGLSTMDIVAVLTKVIQAQQQQIDELEVRLDRSE